MSVSIVDYIVNKVYLPDFISRFTELKKVSGDEYRGTCPIHKGADNDTSLVVKDKLFFCHACHSGGTIINFVADMEQLPYNIATERVCEEFNIDISDNQQYRTQVSIVDKFTRLATTFAEGVNNVKDYLINEPRLSAILPWSTTVTPFAATRSPIRPANALVPLRLKSPSKPCPTASSSNTPGRVS